MADDAVPADAAAMAAKGAVAVEEALSPTEVDLTENVSEKTPNWKRVSANHVGKAIDIVRQCMDENMVFFTMRPLRTNKILHLMQRSKELLNDVETAAYAVANAAERRDIHPSFRFNGFRSLLAAFVRCLQHLHEALLTCTAERESFFFRADSVYERIEDYGVRMPTAFYTLFSAAVAVDEILPEGEHFAHAKDSERAREVVAVAERMDITCFFGARGGFQYRSEMQQVMRVVLLAMAGYSDAYHSENKSAFTKGVASAWAAFKYALNPEEQATKLVALLRSRRPDFTKSFFNLTESTFVKNVSRVTIPRLQVNRLVKIFASPLLFHGTDGNVPVFPDLLSRLGTMRAEQDIGEAAPISDGYAKRAFRGVNLVRAAATQEELDDIAKQLRHICDTDTQIKTDVERRSLRAILAQAYAFASKELKRAATAPTAAAAAAEEPSNATQPANQSLASPLDAVAKGTTASVTDSVFRPEEDEKMAASAGDGPPSAVDSGTANPANGAAATEADVSKTNQAQEEEDALEEPPFIVEEAPVEDPQAAHTPMSSDKFELGDYAVSVMSRVRLGSRTGPSHPSASDARAAALDHVNLPKFGSITLRLLSHRKRQGQLKVKTEASDSATESLLPPAKNLLFHVHGGGFIANTSESHGVYLAPLAQDLESTVIVSIDYSVAPEAPYPRAAQECFYAYAWCLEHAALLGTKAERVVVLGDSAGGNLVTSLTLRALMEGLRPPDAIFAVYPAFNVELSVSASRILAAFDSILSHGVLETCLESYVGAHRLGTDAARTDPLLSPLCAPASLLERLPPIVIFAVELDPLLDDSLAFAKRLHDLNVRFALTVIKDVPHGFLSFKDNCKETLKAYLKVLRLLQGALNGDVPLSEVPDKDWQSFF